MTTLPRRALYRAIWNGIFIFTLPLGACFRCRINYSVPAMPLQLAMMLMTFSSSAFPSQPRICINIRQAGIACNGAFICVRPRSASCSERHHHLRPRSYVAQYERETINFVYFVSGTWTLRELLTFYRTQANNLIHLHNLLCRRFQTRSKIEFSLGKEKLESFN